MREIEELLKLELLEWNDSSSPSLDVCLGNQGLRRVLRLTQRGRLLGNQAFSALSVNPSQFSKLRVQYLSDLPCLG